MSAFIVKDRTIDVIVGYLNYYCITDEEIKRLVKLAGFELPLDCTRLGVAMLDLNTKAYNFRYNVQEKPHEYRPVNEMACSDIVAVKQIKCWLYQCSEGEEFEDTKLYQVFSKIGVYLLKKIVRSLPAYEKAPWGL